VPMGRHVVSDIMRAYDECGPESAYLRRSSDRKMTRKVDSGAPNNAQRSCTSVGSTVAHQSRDSSEEE
jgi:hypothetical protein